MYSICSSLFESLIALFKSESKTAPKASVNLKFSSRSRKRLCWGRLACRSSR